MPCVQPEPFSRRRNRWQDKRQRQLAKLANMRAAKARKRQELIAAGLWEAEPKMERYYPLSMTITNKATGESATCDLKSVRDASRRLAVILKYYL